MTIRESGFQLLGPPNTQPWGFECRLRRVVKSPRFQEIFGEIDWPKAYTPDDALGEIVPVGRRKMSAPRTIGLLDVNGDTHDCVVEAFNSTYQVFVLLHASETLRPILVANAAKG